MKTRLLIFLAISFMLGTCKAQTNNVNLFGSTINYQTGTAIMTTVNTVLTTLNASGVTPKWQAQYTAGVALVTGGVQLAYGIYKAGSSFGTLNVVNMTAGVATIVTNSILLYQYFHSGGKKKTSFNIYINPNGIGNSTEYGFTVVKKINI